MQEASPSGSANVVRAAVAGLVVVIVAVAAYAFHQRSVSKGLAEQNRSVTAALNSQHDQINALTAKLEALTAQHAAENAVADHPPVYRKPMASASGRRRIEDPRWKKMQAQLDDQGRQIDATRQDLTSARTELQGSIATTHDELVLLEKKGERNYFEFDLDKAGQFTREGPVGVRLHKANTKHEYADLELMVDDFKVSKKHVNIYEPVVFYSADSKLPIELVINSISKNHIHGYVAEPKYKSGDLQAMANASGNTATAPTAAQPTSSDKPSPAVRQKLELPRN
jgi:uncharacterized coiled-coil protein SlyX